MDGLDVAAICDAMATQIADQVGITGYDHLPAKPEFPAVCVYPTIGADAIDYHLTFGDSTTYPSQGAIARILLTVRIYASGDDQVAQHDMYEYVSAGAGHSQSVFNAIYSTSGAYGLLGLVPATICRTARPLGLVVSERVDATWMAWGFEFDLEIMTGR